MKSRLVRETLVIVGIVFFFNGLAYASPKLVEMVPSNGEKDVDPSLETVRFVFDEDMTVGRHYSICGGGDAFPGGNGSPKWINNRTLEWPVELKANHEYRFSINCPSSHKGFRNRQGQPADYTPLSFTTGEQRESSEEEASPASVAALFQQALYAERTEGDLEKAISIYQQVLDQAADVERVAARALLQMAGCYEKKGEDSEAAECYKKIIDYCKSQKSALKKAQSKLKELAPVTTDLQNQLPVEVWSYLGNEFVSIYKEASLKGIASNVNIFGVDNQMMLGKGGIIMYKNNTGATITPKQEVRLTRSSHNDLIAFDQNGQLLSSRMEQEKFEPNKYVLFFSPNKNIYPNEIMGIGYQRQQFEKLSQNTDSSYSITMQNFFGSDVLEAFFLITPSDISLVSPSSKPLTEKNFGKLKVYQWKDEIKSGNNHQVSVKLLKENLQSRIDNAAAGDTLILNPGVYKDPITITKPLTLRGQSFADCRFEIVSDNPAIQIKGVGTAGEVKLENLTINWQLKSSEKNETPFAVYCLDSNVIINGCILENKTSKEKAPAGIYAKGFSKLTLTNSQIEGPFDYAVNFGERTKGLVADCLIKGPDHQGVMLYSGSDVVVERNIITGSNYHGVRTTGGKLTLRDNIIIDNKNRGVYLGSRSGSGIIENNIIANSGTGIGGFASSRFDIKNNVIVGSSYAGIGFEKSCALMIENNIFADNERAWIMFDRGGENNNSCRRNTFWKNKTLTEGFSHTGNSIIEHKDYFVNLAYEIAPNCEAAKEEQGLKDADVLKKLFKRWDRRNGIEKYISDCVKDIESCNSQNKQTSFTPDASYMRNNEFMKFSITQPNGISLGKQLWLTRNNEENWEIESFMTIDAGGASMQQYSFVEADKTTLKPNNAITENWGGKFEITYENNTVISKANGTTKTMDIKGSVFDNEQAFYVIRSMPLKEGYSQSFTIYPPQSGVISECNIKVVAIEKIEFCGNETDCFKTILTCSANGQPLLSHTLWITTDSLHWIAKYDAGTAVMKLAEYGVREFPAGKEDVFEMLKNDSAKSVAGNIGIPSDIDMNKIPTDEEKKEAENFRTSGWRLFMQGKPAEAEVEFKKALALYPQMENGWQGLGWSQRNQMKNIQARESFEKCLELNPKNSAALNGMGQIAKAEGDLEKAEMYWKKGVAADRNATGPMLGLAQMYEEQEEYRNSLKYYNMWLKFEPNNQMAKDGVERVKEELQK